MGGCKSYYLTSAKEFLNQCIKQQQKNDSRKYNLKDCLIHTLDHLLLCAFVQSYWLLLILRIHIEMMLTLFIMAFLLLFCCCWIILLELAVKAHEYIQFDACNIGEDFLYERNRLSQARTTANQEATISYCCVLWWRSTARESLGSNLVCKLLLAFEISDNLRCRQQK